MNQLDQKIVQAKSDRKYYENRKNEKMKIVEVEAKKANDLDEEFKVVFGIFS